MTARKERLTVTVDPLLVQAGNQAVRAGLADSLSGWVNEALAEKVACDRRSRLLSEAVADYEARFGEISPEEVAAQQRIDAEAAVVVRGRPKRASGPGGSVA